MATKFKKAKDNQENELITSLHEPQYILPIEKIAKELIYTIEMNDVTIVMGETGSGKTTSNYLF